MLATALDSLAAQTFRDFRIVVVDDASSDGTPESVRERWPEVQLIAHPRNLGVTAALNTGLRTSSSEFVMLLNNDMDLEPHCLEELIRALRAHPEAGSAAGKLLSYHDRGVLDGAGDTFHWAGIGWRRGHGERDVGQYETPQPIFGACAGAAVYRRSAVEVVGPMDESFFAFCEDVDWSFRAQLCGYACRYVPSAVGYHIGSATLGKGESDFTRYHLWRNGLWLVLKDYPLPLLVLELPRVTLHQLNVAVVALRDRKLGLLLRVWRDVVRGLPATLRKRTAVQRARTARIARLRAAVREGR